jgi:crossover junction endodeoxyribonuclease RuvC
MTVLGIDPGLATMGYGVVRREAGKLVVVDFGVVETKAGLELGTRLCILRDGVRDLIRKHNPDSSAIERLLFSNNQRTVMEVARASGAILLSLADAGCACTEYSPPEVKLAVTGEGRAAKNQVGYMIRQLLSLREVPKPDDAADALAIAVCHIQHQLIRR